MTNDDQSRIQRGTTTHAQLFGTEANTRLESYGVLGELVRNFAYGEVISREGLDLKTREMLTVAMLIVLGHEPELRIHLRGALNAGVSPQELEEIIIHTVPYNGFPTAINAKHILDDILAEQ